MKNLLLLAAVLLLVGCSGDSTSKPAPEESNTPPTETMETSENESETEIEVPDVAEGEAVEEVRFEEPEMEFVENELEDPELIPVSKTNPDPTPQRRLSHVEAGIRDYKSCVSAGMETVIVGQNETSVCTTTDGRKFRSKIPEIWANEDIPNVRSYIACMMGGLPMDLTDPENPVCFMPDGRILYQE